MFALNSSPKRNHGNMSDAGKRLLASRQRIKKTLNAAPAATSAVAAE